MAEEKKYYIPADGKRIYVEKEIFDEFNRLRSRQSYSNNKFRAHTCELNEETDVIAVSGVEELVLERLQRRMMAKALSSLDERQRRVISLIFGSGMSEREVAERMGIQRYQVNRIKRRALAELKDKISL